MIQKMQVISLKIKKTETENTKLRLTAPDGKTLHVCKKLNIIYNVISFPVCLQKQKIGWQ